MGKEGIRFISNNQRTAGKAEKFPGIERGAGEVKFGKGASNKNFISTIEPMHGTEVVVYLKPIPVKE